jgi:hypothetical protein
MIEGIGTETVLRLAIFSSPRHSFWSVLSACSHYLSTAQIIQETLKEAVEGEVQLFRPPPRLQLQRTVK